MGNFIMEAWAVITWTTDPLAFLEWDYETDVALHNPTYDIFLHPPPKEKMNQNPTSHSKLTSRL